MADESWYLHCLVSLMTPPPTMNSAKMDAILANCKSFIS